MRYLFLLIYFSVDSDEMIYLGYKRFFLVCVVWVLFSHTDEKAKGQEKGIFVCSSMFDR